MNYEAAKEKLVQLSESSSFRVDLLLAINRLVNRGEPEWEV
jgi:hypothetical protein